MILGLIVFIICKIFISFWIEVFPNCSETPTFNLSVQMPKDYGTTIPEKEFEDLKEKSALREKEADEYLKGDKEAQELGIKSYRELRESLDKGKTANKQANINKAPGLSNTVRLIFQAECAGEPAQGCEFWRAGPVGISKVEMPPSGGTPGHAILPTPLQLESLTPW